MFLIDRLAHVLENLMGFDGSEFYMQNWPELEGATFGTEPQNRNGTRTLQTKIQKSKPETQKSKPKPQEKSQTDT